MSQSTTPRVRAIPTTREGVEMRSRHEARWSVFLTNIGAKWEYEPQQYSLHGWPRYTPDFHLLDTDVILEIKPNAGLTAELGAKYDAYGSALAANGLCRFYVCAVGSPAPGRQYVGYSRYGVQPFRFEALYDEHAVRLACNVADNWTADPENQFRRFLCEWQAALNG